MLAGFPLLLIPVAIYNMVAFLMPDLAWTAPLREFTLASGQKATITMGGGLIMLALLFLFFEILKATRPAVRSIIDHLLSTLIFIGALVEFLLLPQAASETFLVLLVVLLVDVIGGWSVSVRTAQRDISLERSLPEA